MDFIADLLLFLTDFDQREFSCLLASLSEM